MRSRGVKTSDRRLLELSLQHHHFVTKQLVDAAGLSDRQWRSRVGDGLWVPIVPGCWRHAATPPTFDLRVRAHAAWLGDGVALTAQAGAAWWGLDGFGPDEEIFFLAPRSMRGLRGAPLILTRDWRPGDLLRHSGVRVTSVARTVIEMAGKRERARRLESAIDSGIRLRRTSLPTLRRRIESAGGKGATGIPLLRELLLDSGGESALERRFLALMRTNGLPRPETQVSFRRGSSRVVRVDFLFGPRTVVEVSGRLGHSTDSDRSREVRRRNELTKRGLRIIEFTTAEVIDDPEYVITTVRSEL